MSHHAVERDIDNKASTALNPQFIGLNGGPQRRFLSGDAGFEKPPDITADRPPVERPPRVAAACVRVGPIEDFGRLQVRPVEEERPVYRLIDHGEAADRLDKASRGKPQFLHDNRRNACRFRLLAIGQVKDSGRRIRQAHLDRIGSHRIDRNQIQRCSRLAQYADAAVRMRKARCMDRIRSKLGHCEIKLGTSVSCEPPEPASREQHLRDPWSSALLIHQGLGRARRARRCSMYQFCPYPVCSRGSAGRLRWK